MERSARVVGLHLSGEHRFSKTARDAVRMTAGVGVVGDAHAGATVQHRSRVAVDPTRPNLRQVHLVHGELYDELDREGFGIGPGSLGENVTTRDLDLLALPTGALLRLGEEVLLAVTGLRNPCAQIESFRPGLLARVVHRDATGRTVRRAGIMAVVVQGGLVHRTDPIHLALPPGPHRPLERV